MKSGLPTASGTRSGRHLLSLVALAAMALTVSLLLPAAAFAQMTTGDGGWVWQDPLPQGHDLAAVSAIDATHAVAAGDGGGVLTTADGGLSWSAHDVGLATPRFTDFSFVDANMGWAVASIVEQDGFNSGSYVLHTSDGGTFSVGSGSGAYVLHTGDGGASWAVQRPLPGAVSVQFLDARRGWACGGNVVWSTVDGGLTWHAHCVRTNWILNDVAFVDASHGWAVGDRQNYGGALNFAIILATTDGGATWHKQYLPAHAEDGAGIRSVSFVDASHGWAADSTGAILATTNGGRTWQTRAIVPPEAYGLSGLAFTDVSQGWVWTGSKVFATRDGGSTWSGQDVGNRVCAVSFADSLHGYAVGVGGSVATTVDGGASWQARTSAAPAAGVPRLADIAFPDASHGWAVGDGVIMATADGGVTWGSRASGTALARVSFPDATHGWAVGATKDSRSVPVIIHTGDGGSTWQTQYVGAGGGSFGDVDFVDADHGWAASGWNTSPGQAIIARTADGGATWASAFLPQAPPGPPTAISFADAQHGWAVASARTGGQLSAIYATSDGGLTWARQYTGAGVTLGDIAFPDANHGWAVGEAADPAAMGELCVVLSTADGGATWTRQDLPAGSRPPLYLRITFGDSSHGWIVRGSVVYATIDGGQHWWPERVGAQVLGLAFSDASHGWAAAESAYQTLSGGGILSTTTGGLARAPVTTVIGADDRWRNRAQHLAFSAQDEPGGAGMLGGLAKTEYRLDQGPWIAGTAVTVEAPADHSNDGVHLVAYHSIDAAGNAEVIKVLAVCIDTAGPTTAARSTSGRPKVVLQLRYRISDRLGSRVGSERVVLRTARGKLVRIFAAPLAPLGIWTASDWRPRARGVYRYFVYATDEAGNRQRNVAHGTVVVR
jgi:photosystem II stability/assembly factor-like uncharacterized protein